MLALAKLAADFSMVVRIGESATYFSRPTPTALDRTCGHFARGDLLCCFWPA